MAFKERREVGAPPWIVLGQKLEWCVIDTCAGAGRVEDDGVLLEARVGREEGWVWRDVEGALGACGGCFGACLVLEGGSCASQAPPCCWPAERGRYGFHFLCCLGAEVWSARGVATSRYLGTTRVD